MAKCKNCGDWCKEEYIYCWHCNSEEVYHFCKDCRTEFYGERWKTQCRQCWIDEQNQDSEYKKRPKYTRKTTRDTTKQIKLSDF